MAASPIAAQSPADIFNDNAGKVPPSEDQSQANAAAADALKTAQASDRAKVTATTPPPEGDAPPVQADPPAKQGGVPGIPEKSKQEPTEWVPKDAKAAEHFKAIKKQRDEYRASVESLKAEIQQAKQSGANPEELTKLREDLRQYQELVRDVAIERDPEFNQRFTVRQNAAIEAAKLAAGDKAGKLEQLLKAPSGPWRDEQINQIMDDLPESSKRRVNAALGILEQVDVERSTEIAARRQTFEQKQATTQRQQQEQALSAKYNAEIAFKNEVKAWTDPENGHPFLIKREGDDSVDQAYKVAEAVHKSFMEGQWSPQDAARAALQVAVAQRATEIARAATERAEKAEKMLEKMRGVQPGEGRVDSVNGDGEVDTAPAPGTEEYNRWVAKTLSQAQQLDRAKKFARVQ